MAINLIGVTEIFESLDIEYLRIEYLRKRALAAEEEAKQALTEALNKKEEADAARVALEQASREKDSPNTVSETSEQKIARLKSANTILKVSADTLTVEPVIPEPESSDSGKKGAKR